MNDLIPGWMRLGGAGALAFLTVTMFGPFLVRRSLEKEPQGSKDDPLAPRGQSPRPDLYQPPTHEKLTEGQMALVWAAVWKQVHGDVLNPAQVAVLVGHSSLATAGELTSNNLIGWGAGRFYDNVWTVEAVPEWQHPRPVWRWSCVRAYLDPRASAQDWLRNAPQAALRAVKLASPRRYAAALVGAKLVRTPLDAYAPELEARARAVLKALRGEGLPGPKGPKGPRPEEVAQGPQPQTPPDTA